LSKKIDLSNVKKQVLEKYNIVDVFRNDGIELILPPAEQSFSDVYKVGERIKVYVTKTDVYICHISRK